MSPGAGTFAARPIALGGIIALALGASAVVRPAAAQSLISVDFSHTGFLSPFSGVEPQAAALHPVFATANVWNQLAGGGGAMSDPSWSALLASTGAPTAASLSITGVVSVVSLSVSPDPLFKDYLFFNSGSLLSTQIDWRISGLASGATYQMVLYGANANFDRTFDMLVDTDGDGDLTDEVAVEIATLPFAIPAPAYIAPITASASGEIVGRGVGIGAPTGDPSNQANWAGFQLAELVAPETLMAEKDSFLRRGNPDRNEGANPGLRLQASGDNRVVVGFDPAAIDDFGSVTSATLVLTVAENADNWGRNDDRTVDAHPLTVDFAEGNGQNAGVPGAQSTRGSGPGVTWNCAVDAEIANQRTDCDPKWNGGAFGPATAAPVLHFNGLTGEVSWDVTDDALAGASAWLIKKTSESQSGKVGYFSREGADAAGDPDLAPRLILE